MSRRYVATPIQQGEEQAQVVDGLPVRFRLDRSNGTERAEAFWQGEWHVLWKARRVSKGGKRAWEMKQHDLVKAVWTLRHGRAPKVCPSCHLIVEDVDPRIIRSRTCRKCQQFT